MYKKLSAVFVGLALFTFTVLTDNFSLTFPSDFHSEFLAALFIILPKLAYSFIIGIGFFLIIPHERLKNSLLITLCPVCAAAAYQTVKLFMDRSVLSSLMAVADVKGMNYPFPLWIFLASLVFLEILFYEKEWTTVFLKDLLAVAALTVVFALPHLLFDFGINYIYLSGFQIGMFFVVRGIFLEK